MKKRKNLKTMADYMIPDWAKEMNCAVTVCDSEGVIIYMNDKAKETFASHGELVGRNLMGCHSERSKEIIAGNRGLQCLYD